MRFFIYSRQSVSSARGESIENQIEMCRSYIFSRFPDTQNSNITVYEDEGFSAKSTSRPQFLRMQKDLNLLKPDCLVCYRLDRISRNVGDFSAFIEHLNRMNIAFVCINEDFDTSKPMGKAMMYITSVFAQLERETIAERVKDNMLLLARTGRWLGGTAPLGFYSALSVNNSASKVKSAYYLKETEAELETVELIFKNFRESKSLNAVSRMLAENGILNRNKRKFSASAVKQILQNPVYCSADTAAFTYFRSQNAQLSFKENECDSKIGLIAYNKRNYSQKFSKMQGIENWIVAKGRHIGVISGEDWVTVQNIIKKNRKSNTLNNQNPLMSGIIYCKKCGSPMLAKRRSNSSGFDYICFRKQKGTSKACDNKNLSGLQADRELFKRLAVYLYPDDQNPPFKELTEMLDDTQKQQLIKTAVLRAQWDGERIFIWLK